MITSCSANFSKIEDASFSFSVCFSFKTDVVVYDDFDIFLFDIGIDDFVQIQNTTNKFYNFQIDDSYDFLRFRVVGHSSSGDYQIDTKNFIVPKEDLVIISGFYKDINGKPINNERIDCRLRPQYSDTEFSGSVLSRDTHVHVDTDDDGFWQFSLPPNISDDPNKKIVESNTYYEFTFRSQTFKRIIKYEDGVNQNFFSLKEPELYRKRKYNYHNLDKM